MPDLSEGNRVQYSHDPVTSYSRASIAMTIKVHITVTESITVDMYLHMMILQYCV